MAHFGLHVVPPVSYDIERPTELQLNILVVLW